MAKIDIKYDDYNNVLLVFDGDADGTFEPLSNSSDFNKFFNQFVKRKFDVKFMFEKEIFNFVKVVDSANLTSRSMIFDEFTITYRSSGGTITWGVTRPA